MSVYHDEYESKATAVNRELDRERDEEYGPATKEIMELHKRTEHLHIMLDSLERKLRPVLRTVPDPDAIPGERVPRPVTSEVTDRLHDINAVLSRLDLRIADMITRCEL